MKRDEHPSRLLIVLPTWVGDFVMATPTLRAIRQRFGGSHIAFLSNPKLMPLIAGGPWTNDVIVWSHRPRAGQKGESLWALARRLREQRFDAAVLLSNSFRSGLIVWLAGIPRRIGYARDGRTLLLTDRLRPRRKGRSWVPYPMVEYYGAIAEYLGCLPPGDDLELYTSVEDRQAVADRLRVLGLSDRHPRVVLAPGASFGASKCWPPEYFAELGDRLIEKSGAAVFITCGPGEEDIARRIGRAMRGGGVVLDAPPMGLAELKALIEGCDLLVSNDIGPRHFAKAFGVPVVTMFGPTFPEWTDTRYSLERKVRIEVDCGPCQQRVCPLGHHKCMIGLTVDMVHAACVELLNQRGTAGMAVRR